uniref:Uncharacterized protein n=1 Tax=Aureoumbra lagunensis TaxID=44058 RepID=A0A7S3K0Q4_9STRA
MESEQISKSPTLSLAESSVDVGFDAEMRRHLEAELIGLRTKFERYKADSSRSIESMRRAVTEAQNEAQKCQIETQRARAALEERRDAIEAGFRDGAAYAQAIADDALESTTEENTANIKLKAVIDELRQRPTEELSLRELAAVRVADVSRAAYLRSSVASRSAADALREKRQAQVDCRQAQEDAVACEKARDQAERRLKIERERSQDEIKRLTEMERISSQSLRQAQRELNELATCKAELAKLRADEDRRAQLASDAAQALERAAQAESSCISRIADAERFASLAKLDQRDAEAIAKEHERRAAAAEHRCDMLERDNTEKRQEIAEIRQRLADAASDFKSQLEAKCQSLDAAAKLQIDELREQRRHLDRNEIEALREARRDAVTALDRELSAKRDLERDLASARSEAADARAEKLATIAQVSADRKILEFELATAKANAEEANDKLQALTNKADLLREQLDLAERAYNALKADSDNEQRLLNYRIIDLQDKVTAYEKLEIELDAAVIRSGAIGDSSSQERKLIPGTLETSAGLSRPQRRVQHAVMLAQQLLKTQTDLEKMLRQHDAASAARAACEAKLALTNNRLLEASKPAKYLLSALQERDEAVAALRHKLDQARNAARAAVTEAQTVQEHNTELEAQVKRLIKHRAELAQLKQLLTQLRSDPAALPPIILPAGLDPSIPLPPGPLPHLYGSVPGPFVNTHSSHPPPHHTTGLETPLDPHQPLDSPTLAAHTRHTDDPTTLQAPAPGTASAAAAVGDNPAPTWVSKHPRVGEVC